MLKEQTPADAGLFLKAGEAIRAPDIHVGNVIRRGRFQSRLIDSCA